MPGPSTAARSSARRRSVTSSATATWRSSSAATRSTSLARTGLQRLGRQRRLRWSHRGPQQRGQTGQRPGVRRLQRWLLPRPSQLPGHGARRRARQRLRARLADQGRDLRRPDPAHGGVRHRHRPGADQLHLPGRQPAGAKGRDLRRQRPQLRLPVQRQVVLRAAGGRDRSPGRDAAARPPTAPTSWPPRPSA